MINAGYARWCLPLFHILVIASSNYLVQIPIDLWGVQTTWGAFTFPFVFLATDLTVRIFGSGLARWIIFLAMLPALVISYLCSVWFHDGIMQGMTTIQWFDLVAFRVACASFMAYVLGQILDIYVFNRWRQSRRWWLAPSASTIVGSFLDTLSFFAIAFYQSSNPFMADHWMEIAAADYAIKLAISFGFFVPAYGVLLRFIMTHFFSEDLAARSGSFQKI